MMSQAKIEQSNQMMGQKPTMHVQNINAQNVTIQSIAPPQSAQQIGQTQNQIQIQPILQQSPMQQQQPNQMQIPMDQSGVQMQFVNSGPPGNATNFNPTQQQQMKIVQQQINIQQHQQQPAQQQQQMQQVG